MDAYRLPNQTEEEKKLRKKSIQEAIRYATEIPFRVMKTAFSVLELAESMAEKGMKSSISDVGVGALCIQTAMSGAFLNVKINAASLDDKDFAKAIVEQGNELVENMQFNVKKIMEIVHSKIN